MEARLGGAGAAHDGDDARESSANVPFTTVHHLVRRFLEPAQDALVVLLSLGLFGIMVRTLLTIAMDVFAPALNLRVMISEALFALVMVELQRLLIMYLRDHHVSVDVMVEATIVASLREVLLLSAAEMEPLRLIALTVFILGLGVLLRFGDLRAPRRRIHDHGSGRGGAMRHGPRARRPASAAR